MRRYITALILCFGLMLLTACSHTATTHIRTTTEGETMFSAEEEKVLALYKKMSRR